MMGDKDYYEDLCRYYAIFSGTIPFRDQFKDALKMTIDEDALNTFFKIPSSGNITLSKLRKKTSLTEIELKERLEVLASEGFILLYETDRGQCCERGNPIFMTEQQVRKKEDTVQKKVFARFFNAGIEGGLESAIETKTPYFRVLPAEPTVTSSSELRTIDIDVPVPAPGEVAPIDVITEMIKDVSVIGVAQCFCRLTKQQMNEGCGHALETCFVCNDLAQTLIQHGAARKIEYEEAIRILKDCEAKGLVHNIDNCSSNIRAICNCCSCCCIILRSLQRGESSAGAPSRFVVQYDAEKCENCQVCVSRCPTEARQVIDGNIVYDKEKCIGCGLCVSTCPSGSNLMILRDKPYPVPATHEKMSNKIRREALFSIVKKSLFKK